jgi:hypothetical protein
MTLKIERGIAADNPQPNFDEKAEEGNPGASHDGVRRTSIFRRDIEPIRVLGRLTKLDWPHVQSLQQVPGESRESAIAWQHLVP